MPDVAPGGVSWSTLEHEVAHRLAPLGADTARLEARWLVEEVSGLDAGERIAAGDEPATRMAVARLDVLIGRRLAGEPIQYVLGRWAFRTLDLFVDRRVLIPRPETEVLVDHVLDALDRVAEQRPRPGRLVDLGTGSGAIALSVAAERRDVEVWATDASDDALAVARANLAGLGRPAQRVRLAHGPWFDALDEGLRGAFDVVAANPPYVADDEVLPEAVEQWEPAGALRSGPTGREALEHILAVSPGWLAPEGLVVLELAPHQAADVEASARRLGYDAEIRPDLTGHPRVLVGRWRGS